MATKTKYPALGSVSSGTLKPEDLIPAFLDVLGGLNKTRCEEIEKDYPDLLDPDVAGPETADPEAEAECLEELFEALEELAPPYCYFGTHEGDGIDFGFWPDWGGIEEAVRDGTLLKLPAGEAWPPLGSPSPPLGENTTHDETEDPEVECVLEVTDHGNATLFDREGNELWSVV